MLLASWNAWRKLSFLWLYSGTLVGTLFALVATRFWYSYGIRAKLYCHGVAGIS